ncbi:trehalose-phosphatase [Enemella sp. A6]|uniref:trehalose-phosphatase n=1 Tax=Enemella sp. A6 TaxID=3440152 RepID=UPI003EB9CD81
MTDVTPGSDGLSALVAAPERGLVAVDFDGTLAPIVPDPEQAVVDPTARAALARMGRLVGTVAVITGRPTRTAVRLGGFEGVEGLEDLIVLGQYGVERWDAATGEYLDPPIPREVIEAKDAMAELIADEGVMLEDKGRAIALHFRNAERPQDTMDRYRDAVRRIAEQRGLTVEPGRLVFEVRATGMDKGQALRALVAEREARAVIFCGDDLGDVAAFAAVDELAAEGVPGVKVAVVSQEQQALAARADVVVTSPADLAGWLDEVAEKLARP